MTDFIITRGQMHSLRSAIGTTALSLELEDDLKPTLSKPCGHSDYNITHLVDETTVSFGRGQMTDLGGWEFPCLICAKAYAAKHPDERVWPEV